MRILPLMWPRTWLPFWSSTLNMAFGRDSTTVPSISMAPCFLATLRPSNRLPEPTPPTRPSARPRPREADGADADRMIAEKLLGDQVKAHTKKRVHESRRVSLRQCTRKDESPLRHATRWVVDARWR